MKADRVAAVMIVASAAVLYALGGLAPLSGAGANRNASFWPTVLLGLFAVLGLALGVKSALPSRGEPSSAAATLANSGSANSGWIRNAVAMLTYIPTLFVFGFYVSALAYAFVLPRMLGGVRWRAAALFSVGFTAVLYAVFTVALRMELPSGYVMLVWARFVADGAR